MATKSTRLLSVKIGDVDYQHNKVLVDVAWTALEA